MKNIAVIVDLETTGLDFDHDQIIEIGAIKFNLNTGEVIETFQTFTMPDENYYLDNNITDEDDEIELEPFELDPFIVELTGITEDMLVGSPSNEEAVANFFAFAGHNTIWAYNAGFDSRFLNKHTSKHHSLRDIIPIAKRAFPNLKNYKLATVGAHLNLSTEGTHRAIADCLISKEILVLGLKIHKDNPSLQSHSHYLKASDYVAKEDGVFFGKTIVFTGALVSLTRENAAETASKYGFTIGSAVTKKTNYLVVGFQDPRLLAGNDKSTKHRKAEELISGGSEILIINENEFLKMIS
jgi:DNA polymerase III subunit epsilon